MSWDVIRDKLGVLGEHGFAVFALLVLGGALILIARKGWLHPQSAMSFGQQVYQEVEKVTWPSRKEVWVTTLAVLVMVTLASLFFLMADQFLGWVVSLILGLGR